MKGKSKGAKHSLYKHPKKWEKATDLQRTMSTFTREVNYFKKRVGELLFELRVRSVQVKRLEKAINWATESGRVKKGEFKPFLKSKAQIKKELKQKLKIK